MAEVRGPLGRVVTATSRPHRGGSAPDLAGPGALSSANARLVLHRCFLGADGGDTQDTQDTDSHVRGWAVRTNLGQNGAADLMAAVIARRQAALEVLRRSGCEVRSVTLTTRTPLLTGTGDAGVRNVGIALHGTYGWPQLPGSTIKGVAHAHARDEAGTSLDQREAVFGAPRPGEDHADEARDGAAVFLDALPGETAARVGEQVMTPHHRDYYEGRQTASGTRTPPAEYHNPVPVPFLVIDSGVFHTAVVVDHNRAATDQHAAREHAVKLADDAAALLKEAVDELGLGAKTAAGFGYLAATIGRPSRQERV